MPHEGSDAQVLFECLEEQFNLPPLAVDGGDGGGGKATMIGEKHNATSLFLVPDFDARQKQIVVPTAGRLPLLPQTTSVHSVQLSRKENQKLPASDTKRAT